MKNWSPAAQEGTEVAGLRDEGEARRHGGGVVTGKKDKRTL